MKDWECIYHHKNMCGRGPMCLIGEDLRQCSSRCRSNKTAGKHREETKNKYPPRIKRREEI